MNDSLILFEHGGWVLIFQIFLSMILWVNLTSKARQVGFIPLLPYQGTRSLTHLDFCDCLCKALPLLGILGTVQGMITIFSNPIPSGALAGRQLARGISEALITTEYGLLVAVPAMVLLSLIKKRAEHENLIQKPNASIQTS